MFKFERTLHTNGKGYWSEVAAAVKTVKIDVPYINDEQDFGELCVYINTASWKTKDNGDIYTDPQFIKELRKELDLIGLPGSDVEYSEHGMQRNAYVSFDVTAPFIAAWTKKVSQLMPNL